MPEVTYKTRRGFNTSGRDYAAGEPFPADGHDVPLSDIDILVSRELIAEASMPQSNRAAPDDGMRQENEALKRRVAELEQQLAGVQGGSAEPSEPALDLEQPARRRGRPPKVRTEETDYAQE